jgi:ankyrin repeat protein
MKARVLDRIAAGRTDLVFELLAAGLEATSPGPDGVPVIRWCARYGDVSAIRYLLDHGESLLALGENFDLGGAAYHGHWRLCEFLIEQGADANHADPATGETPLHLALCKPNRPAYDLVVRALLAGGADPNRTTASGVETAAFMRDSRTRGETPLHRAAAFGSEAAIRLLLDAGATVEARDLNGDTPLAWASWHTRPDAVLRTLCYGAHRIRPDRDSTFDHGRGWGALERDLLGTPRGSD